MRETSKSIQRRLNNSQFATKYFVGRGVDVGSGDDPLDNHSGVFPLMHSCRRFDKDDGDAQYLHTRHEVAGYDFLHSSHCLEHMVNPWEALREWCKVVRGGGHVVVMVPDEDMYEQGVWPSQWNADHKHTFTIFKVKSWSPVSVNVLDLIGYVADLAECVSVQRLEVTYNPSLRGTDQTLGIGECAIEFILRRH